MLIFKKEKHVRKLVLEHAAQAQLTLEATRPLMAEYLAKNTAAFSLAVATIQDHESRADMLKWEIGEALQSGAFMPMVRSDVYRLVESVDKLAGRGEDLAIFLSNQPPDIAAEFRADYTTILALNVDSTEQLHDALEIYFKPKGKLKELHAHTRQVGQLESEVDQLQGSLMQQIFGSNLDLSTKMHLGQLLGVICGISDAAEDVADELAFAALKSAV